MTADPAVADVTEMVSGLAPADRMEAEHCDTVLAWLASTDDVWRRLKPSTPDPHLVSYVVLLDARQGCILLVEHRLAGLWLPAGGHVEPGEDPWHTARREASEELGILAEPLGGRSAPFFLTRTQTTGPDPHTDVSLWFLLRGDRRQNLAWDRREFASIRWWTPDEIRAEPAERFDPHMIRFLAKLDTENLWAQTSVRGGRG